MYHEKNPNFQLEIIDLVCTDKSQEASALIELLIKAPHKNAYVVKCCYEEAAKRKIKIPKEIITRDAMHYRPSIRDSVREYAKSLNMEIPKFKKENLLLNKEFIIFIEKCISLCPELPSDGTSFVQITVKEKNSKWEMKGFLLDESNEKIILLMPNYKEKIIIKKEKKVKIKILNLFTESKIDLEKDPMDFSGHGFAIGKFKKNPSFEKIFFSLCLYKHNKKQQFLDIFCNVTDLFYDDEHLIFYINGYLGELYGQKMIVEFVGNRDYQKALTIAHRIHKKFPNSRFSHYAQILCEQIPRRQEDFKALVNPTKSEWNTMRVNMSRQEQIQYLCQRLRLLNCFQYMQPGGINYSDIQFNEPSGLDENASFGLGLGKTQVINPYYVLGGLEDLNKDQFNRPKQLKLTVEDLKTLAPFLKENWLLPTVSFWRDFHPGRNLHSTRPIIIGLINKVAGKNLIDKDAVFRAQKENNFDEIVNTVIDYSNSLKPE